MASPSTQTFNPLDDSAFRRCSAVCLGTGRFLRAVLVPALHELGCDVILAQTRGTSFGAYMQKRLDDGAGTTYEVDTVLPDGSTLTTLHPVAACGTLGLPEGRAAFMTLPSRLENLRFIGLGVTEAGLVHNGPAMLALAEFLHACYLAGRGVDAPLSILNTDNVPFNGDAVQAHVLSCDYTQAYECQKCLQTSVVQWPRLYRRACLVATTSRPAPVCCTL